MISYTDLYSTIPLLRRREVFIYEFIIKKNEQTTSSF